MKKASSYEGKKLLILIFKVFETSVAAMLATIKKRPDPCGGVYNIAQICGGLL